MPLPPPTAADRYQVTASVQINETLWNAVLGDVADKQAALATGFGTYQGIVDGVVAQGVTYIQNNVAPLLEDFETSSTQIQARLQNASDLLDAILDGTIAADKVTLTLDDMGATNAQEVFEEIFSELSEISEAVEQFQDKPAAVIPLNGTGPTTYSLSAGQSYRMISPTSQLTLELPADPDYGDTIHLKDGGSVTLTDGPTMSRSGKTIMGLAENMTIRGTPGIEFDLWYDGITWRLS
jgi:hypothetical protein